MAFIGMPWLSICLPWTGIKNIGNAFYKIRDKCPLQKILQNVQYMLLIAIIHLAEIRMLLKQ